MRALRAPLALSLLALTGAHCELPFGAQAGHTVLYLAVLPPGSPFQFPPEAQVADAVDRVRDYFLEASYDVYRMEGASDPESGGDVLGPIQTQWRLFCDEEASFVSAVVRDLAATVDFHLYEHVVVLAPGMGCSLNGLDVGPFSGPGLDEVDAVYVNAQALFYAGNGASGPGIVAHELGHQLGIDHSRALRCEPAGVLLDAGCDDGEYLDLLDVMGASIFFGHYNGFQKEKLGWLPPGAIQEVVESGWYFLTPFESRSFGPKLLKIRRQADSILYVEYHTATGFHAGSLPGFTNGAVFHVAQPFHPGHPFPASFLLRGPGGRLALEPGDALLDARGHEIAVLARSSRGILLDVRLAKAVELDPPEVSVVAWSGPAPGHVTLSITAEDASGIDLIEVYDKTFGGTRFEWDELKLLDSIPAPAGIGERFHVDLDVDLSEVSDSLEVVAFDAAGNVARALGL